jgi:hypothetical protein
LPAIEAAESPSRRPYIGRSSSTPIHEARPTISLTASCDERFIRRNFATAKPPCRACSSDPRPLC